MRRKKQQNLQKPPAKFPVGAKVRVRKGKMDTDYPDMPIGGWAGTVAEVHDDGMYTVRWSPKTLESIHPVFKRRCERDGLEFETYWIGDNDLEHDTGGPFDIEQPTQITARPLLPNDLDDRIRMVFGLTSDDLVPDVDIDSQRVYRSHLSRNLVFPFTAEHGAEDGRPQRVDVLSLGDPSDEPLIDDTAGILCEARLDGQIVTLPLCKLEHAKGSSNRRLIDDYRSWFQNW